MSRVDLVLPVLDPGDAASSHTLQMQRLLRDQGWACDVFVDRANGPMAERARPFAELPAGSPVIYQFAIGSPLADALARPRRPLVVNSHNVTPARYFEVWDPPLVRGTVWGQHQLEALALVADLGLAVSEFNAAHLRAAGFTRVSVAPFLLDPHQFERGADREVLDGLLGAKATVDWLFVGRLVPNKCQHDVIKAFAAYRRCYDDGARLFLVGGASSARYETALRAYAARLGLGEAVRFTGPVSDGVLAAHYQAADVFVCLSEHEGFGVPLVEAMYHGLPVVAFSAAAVPETVGRAGLLLDTKDPVLVATAVDRVVRDQQLRGRLCSAGRDRLGELALERSRVQTLDALGPWLAEVAS